MKGAVLALLLVAAPGQAQTLPRIALYASAAADLRSTWHQMDRGYVELNPILGQSRVRQAGIVIGLTTLADLAASHIAHTGHPRIATVTRLALGGFHFGCAIHNERLK